VALPLIIGVAGGTGSGKTSVARRLSSALPDGACAIIEHDAYYRDRSLLSPDERSALNYDHPDALESILLAEHLRALRRGHPVEVPIYDFVTHTRRSETRAVEPCPVIIVEGIMTLADGAVRECLDIKIYVDTDSDIRLMRRIHRDITSRGRTFESVRDQYAKTVRPMHLQFVEPSKRQADLIIPEGGENRVAIDIVIARLLAAVGTDLDGPLD
jgi:uridine kinase